MGTEKGHIPWNKGMKLPPDLIEKLRQGRLRYYKAHEVWNKGLKWPEDVKARIRKACLEKGVGRWNIFGIKFAELFITCKINAVGNRVLKSLLRFIVRQVVTK